MNRILMITTGGTLACTPTENGLMPTLKGVDIMEYCAYQDADSIPGASLLSRNT